MYIFVSFFFNFFLNFYTLISVSHALFIFFIIECFRHYFTVFNCYKFYFTLHQSAK
jgi:hypothetical protein